MSGRASTMDRVIRGRSDGTALDLFLWNRSSLDRVAWAVSFVGFLGYTLAIVTYALPIGEASMIVALLGLLAAPGRIRMPPFLLLFAAYLGWAAVGYLGTAYPSVVYGTLVDAVKLWLIAFVAVNVIRTPAQLRFYLVFFIACFALFPARGAILNYLGGYTVFGRALWNHIFSNPNDLAALTFLPLSIAVGLVATERKGLFRLGALAALVVLPMLILVTQSRGAFIGLAIVTVFALLSQRRRARAFVTLALLGVVALAVVPSEAWDRFGGLTSLTSTETIAAADEEGSAAARFNIWRTAVVIVGDNSVTGVGLGAYPEAHARYAPLVPDAPRGTKDTHSTYLRILATTGFPGFVLFIVLVTTVFLRAESVRRRLKDPAPQFANQLRALELGLVGYLLAGVFGSFGLLSFLYLHLALLWIAAEVGHEAQRRAAKLARRTSTRPHRALGDGPPARARVP